MAALRLRHASFLHRSFLASKLPSQSYVKTDLLNCKILPVISCSESIRYLSWTGFYTSLATSTPVLTIQDCLVQIHQYSGLPWWAVIVLSTFGIRSLLLPLAIHQQQVISRLANLRKELAELAPELNKEVNIARAMYKWDEETAKITFRRQMKKLNDDRVIRDNCHPAKGVVLILFQIPAWIFFSISLRNLTSVAVQGHPAVYGLTSEGILWFTDLTAPDMYVLPLLLVMVNMCLIEMNSLRHSGKKHLLHKVLLNTFRVVTLVVGAAAVINPSSVTLYWFCSSTFGLCQNVLLMMPSVRRFVRIPASPVDSATPFQDIASNFKKRFQT